MGMKAENWIVTVGILFMLIIAVFAFIPEDYVDIDMPSPPERIALNPAPDIFMNNSPMMEMPPYVGQPMGRAMMQNAAAAQQGAGSVSPGLRAFERAPTVKFNGIVQQVSEMQQHDGQIHIWVDNAQGVETRVSIGPDWFLKYTGCKIAHDITISGVGFMFERAGKDPLVYARKIRIDNKVCRLRNDEGFALWSNRLR